jgi:hypothetical protein
MGDNIVNEKMAEQISVILFGARERFTDRLEEYLKGKKISIQEADKRTIEQLFSEYVQTYIVAELASLICFSIYSTSGNDEILTKTVPDLLDEIESKLGQTPDSLVKKTSGLPACAKKALEKKEEKSELVASLLKDINDMPKTKHLKASFDALLLAFMGE